MGLPFALGLLAIFAALVTLLWLLFAGSGRRQVLENLNRDLDKNKKSEDLPESNSELMEAIRRRTPPAMVKTLHKLWTGAGRPEKWPVDRLLAMKGLLALAGIAATVLLTPAMPGGKGLLLGIGLTLLGFFGPELRLYSMGMERREKIGLQLPDVLDQMSIAVNAGLGFDAAMSRVARNGKGDLANELVRTLQDIQVGMARRDAYNDLAERTGVEKLERFVRAIIQGEAYGIPLSDVLQAQADELRRERRQDAERRAMQIPVKVIFPLLLFIMPAMFIVVIGPGVIQAARAFGVDI
ncbi:MAG: type II secretion system F family protein [Propionibacteriaceae bacterium]|jgi:tight adherence protein C|nr:type II secretion system F family protein [Propionibacteriaceae bacterium]